MELAGQLDDDGADESHLPSEEQIVWCNPGGLKLVPALHRPGTNLTGTAMLCTGHLYCCAPAELGDVLSSKDFRVLRPLPPHSAVLPPALCLCLPSLPAFPSLPLPSQSEVCQECCPLYSRVVSSHVSLLPFSRPRPPACLVQQAVRMLIRACCDAYTGGLCRGVRQPDGLLLSPQV